ncbi:MAG: c-type cytochrome [Actinomycetota bacterium]
MPHRTVVGAMIRGRRWSGAVALLAVFVAACGGDEQAGDAVDRGEVLFADNCAQCHGPEGDGSEAGPPLVHEIYEPGHHPDEAFQQAVAQGVSAHHWNFGDMAPIQGLEPDEVDDIVAYVRELQRDAGIIE